MSFANLPKISVIMPVLNRGDMIEKAIRSVIDQQYENVELIIMDGGSTDNTLAIIKQYEKHITYWHSQHDGSAAKAFNAGIEKATGVLIAHLMADDWLEPGILHKIGQTLCAHPDADIITCTGRIVARAEKSAAYKTIATFNDPRDLKLTFNNICYVASVICCRFIKKSLFERIGFLITTDAQGHQIIVNDKEFLLRAVIHQVKNVFVDYLGYSYFAHSDSFSFGNKRSSSIRHCQQHMDIAATYLAKQPLTTRQRYFMMYWYNDQSVRLTLYSLLDCDWRRALSVAMDGLKKYNFIWPGMFCYTFCRIVVKRSLGRLRHFTLAASSARTK